MHLKLHAANKTRINIRQLCEIRLHKQDTLQFFSPRKQNEKMGISVARGIRTQCRYIHVNLSDLISWLRKLGLCLLHHILVFMYVPCLKFSHNCVFLRRGIEIVPLDILTVTDTEMAPWKTMQLKWHRPPIAGATVPPSVIPNLLQSADPKLFFISTPYRFTISSPWYSYQKERS